MVKSMVLYGEVDRILHDFRGGTAWLFFRLHMSEALYHRLVIDGRLSTGSFLEMCTNNMFVGFNLTPAPGIVYERELHISLFPCTIDGAIRVMEEHRFMVVGKNDNLLRALATFLGVASE